MNYERALRLWGQQKLVDRAVVRRGQQPPDIVAKTVVVRFEFNPGNACCGGSDPNCYCSLAESPSAKIIIEGWTSDGAGCSTYIDAEDFDFVKVLGEIVEAGGRLTVGG